MSTILTLCFFFFHLPKKKPKMSPTTINSRDFLKNNYKTQTISLVSKRFKLISFITIWVQWTRFRKNWCEENMEIEFNELGFHVQKSSSMNLVSMYRNRVCWTRFPYIETEFVELGFCTCLHLWPLNSVSVHVCICDQLLKKLQWHISLCKYRHFPLTKHH